MRAAAVILTAGTLLLVPSACPGAAGDAPSLADPPLGRQGSVAFYRIERTGAAPTSVVTTFALGLGPIERPDPTPHQWLDLHATKADGTTFRAWLLCARYPTESLAQAEEVVARYIVQEGSAEPVEYRGRSTGRPVLPMLGAWPFLLPHPAPGSALEHGHAQTATLLGHRYRLERVDDSPAPQTPPPGRVLELRSDALVGVPHNTRTVDDTRRYNGSDYELARLTAADYDAMIAAGMNCLNVDPEQRRWIERRAVFYWGGEMAGLPYPECLYRSTYLGPVLFLDEPAVGTRDHVLRPRLKQDPRWRHDLTPQIALAEFHEFFRKARHEGSPTRLLRELAARPDVEVGEMDFLQQNLFTWETMVSTAIHQLTEGGSPPPAAMVFEPPGRFGAWRTLPEIDMTYGCQIPVDDPAHLADIIFGFLRGAARLSDRDWGTSIYGAVDRADAPGLLTRAYDRGARMFFFWDAYELACVPFAECLALSRHLQAHLESRPPRDLRRLKRAAETLLLLPPGYNLGHVHLGKGSLWGLGELNLERTNAHGITYRRVMGHLFAEIERCLRSGTDYDLVWDVPGLDPAGYREIVRIREDGRIEVRDAAGRTLQDGPRPVLRPGGTPPGLTVRVSPEALRAPARVTAQATVLEGSAPVYYTIGANRQGVHENALVFWELFGPLDEDYRVLLGDTVRPHIVSDGSSHRVEIAFGIDQPGTYRLRAATADRAGRTAVVWQTLAVGR